MAKEENLKVQFKGLLRWASVPPNPARKPPDEYIDPLAPNNTSYMIEVECTKEKLAALVKKGVSSMTTLKEDEATGKTYLRVKTSKVRRIDGEDVTFRDPFVIDKARQHLDKAIGNGSEGIVVAELTKLKRGAALRLAGVQVLNLIEYVPTESLDKFNDLLENDKSGLVAEDVDDSHDESLDDFI